ncbi:hypothetical protein C8F01DRAFT_1083121 [Mycena amicta]|nr:hypothetical protein C8F01DRAFT_1083121 [Mycena amicta]
MPFTALSMCGCWQASSHSMVGGNEQAGVPGKTSHDQSQAGRWREKQASPEGQAGQWACARRPVADTSRHEGRKREEFDPHQMSTKRFNRRLSEVTLVLTWHSRPCGLARGGRLSSCPRFAQVATWCPPFRWISYSLRGQPFVSIAL